MEVADILQRVNIEDYIAQYLDDGYEEKNGELWCISPLNPSEKTPSFSIRPEEGVFFDFSTGVGGNTISFIMYHDHVSVAEAVRKLKRYANISDVDESSHVITRLEATKIAKQYRSHIRKAPVMTAKSLPMDCMNQYEIRRDKLQLWVDEGISWKTLMKYGVRYDAFDDRIVYPIKDYDGNIISICGRTCDPDYKAKKLRKYTYKQQIGALNTIYGFYDSKSSIIDHKEIILFEGAKSCMKACDWGVLNTGALLTSHLSMNQLKFLIRLCSFTKVVVVFALDSDIDISKDDNIKKLCGYAQVQWVKNRDDLLQPKDSPTDRGKDVFFDLYKRRERCDFLHTK